MKNMLLVFCCVALINCKNEEKATEPVETAASATAAELVTSATVDATLAPETVVTPSTSATPSVVSSATPSTVPTESVKK